MKEGTLNAMRKWEGIRMIEGKKKYKKWWMKENKPWNIQANEK